MNYLISRKSLHIEVLCHWPFSQWLWDLPTMSNLWIRLHLLLEGGLILFPSWICRVWHRKLWPTNWFGICLQLEDSLHLSAASKASLKNLLDLVWIMLVKCFSISVADVKWNALNADFKGTLKRFSSSIKSKPRYKLDESVIWLTSENCLWRRHHNVTHKSDRVTWCTTSDMIFTGQGEFSQWFPRRMRYECDIRCSVQLKAYRIVVNASSYVFPARFEIYIERCINWIRLRFPTINFCLSLEFELFFFVVTVLSLGTANSILVAPARAKLIGQQGVGGYF